MTNVAPNKLIYALRCGFAEGHNAPKCIQERCPYYHKIEFDKKTKDGRRLAKMFDADYWDECRHEQMALDAADALEKLIKLED